MSSIIENIDIEDDTENEVEIYRTDKETDSFLVTDTHSSVDNNTSLDDVNFENLSFPIFSPQPGPSHTSEDHDPDVPDTERTNKKRKSKSFDELFRQSEQNLEKRQIIQSINVSSFRILTSSQYSLILTSKLYIFSKFNPISARGGGSI